MLFKLQFIHTVLVTATDSKPQKSKGDNYHNDIG